MKKTPETATIMRSESLFKLEDYGKPLNERLSLILRRNATKNDFANVAIRSEISFSTIRDVVYRTNSLTKSNARAISLLIYAAFENALAKKLQVEGDILLLDDLLKL